MAKGIFGERFKREREMREVSIAEINRGTRIPERFLQALENEEWGELPGGVFSRGFVRAIARYLGLNEEEFLSEYDLARGQTEMPTPHAYENKLPGPPKWIPAVALIVLIAAIVGAAYGGRLLWKRYSAYRASRPAGSSVRQQTASATSGAANPAGANGSTGAPGASPATGKLELTLSTSVASHVRILADNEVQLDGDVQPGDTHHFTAQEQFQITAADGAAVHLELNGRPITARANLGNSLRSSDTIVLGYKDLRPSDGTIRP
jgi:cytoskeleton protein RodZ